MNFIKALLLFLTFLLAPLQNISLAESDPFILKMINSREIETNFLWLKLHEFQFSHSKSQILVSADIASSNIYAAARGLGEISIVSINRTQNGEFNLTKLNTIKIPTPVVELENVYILDIKFSENKLYSTIFRYSDKENSCSFVELIESDKDLKYFKSIFKSKPCLNIPIGLSNISGRIAVNTSFIFLAGGNMLMDIGNTSFPKDQSEFCCPKNNYYDTMKLTNFFGSVISIEKKTKINKKISVGHRVPEGLFYDNSRNILWQSEHGPRGGDEINLINLKIFSDYGFPFVSLGAPYWKIGNLKTNFNSHENFTQPFFAFVPSIGASQLSLPPESGIFNRAWGKDLMLTSLKDKSIYRLRLLDNKVVYSERIYIGKRLRSIDVFSKNIIMGTDSGSIVLLDPMEKKLEGTFPLGDYDYPRCAERGADKSCNPPIPKKRNWILRQFTF
jgi:hypothetical protein